MDKAFDLFEKAVDERDPLMLHVHAVGGETWSATAPPCAAAAVPGRTPYAYLKG